MEGHSPPDDVGWTPLERREHHDTDDRVHDQNRQRGVGEERRVVGIEVDDDGCRRGEEDTRAREDALDPESILSWQHTFGLPPSGPMKTRGHRLSGRLKSAHRYPTDSRLS